MGGAGVSYCQIPPFFILGQSNVPKVCTEFIKDPVVGRSTKECGDTTTPVLDWVEFNIYSDNVSVYAFALDIYVGVEKRSGTNCLWIGSEEVGVCVSECAEVNERGVADLTYDTLAGLIDKLWGLIEEAANSAEESAPDYVPDIVFHPVVFAIATAVISSIVIFIVSQIALGISLSSGATGLFTAGLGVLA